MSFDDSTRTSGSLIRRAADWRDTGAWQEIHRVYDPYLQRWCREYRLDPDLASEVIQLFWMELAERIRSFSYDPSLRFRGWLRTRFHWRVADASRKRKRRVRLVRLLDEHAGDELEALNLVFDPSSLIEDDDETAGRPLLLDLGEEVQAAVRARVHARTWQVFWHIEVDGWTFRQTAESLNMSYLAVHTAHKRVLERLIAEGNRRLREQSHATNDVRHA